MLKLGIGGVLTVAIALLLCAPAPPGARAAGSARSCGWILEPTAGSQNILFPDTNTEYLAGIVPIPSGGYVEVRGQFPHSRYMSLSTYTKTLQPASDLHDTQIRPDRGSTNPYLPHANRRATHRSYTVRIIDGKAPTSGGPPNTLYDTAPNGQSGQGLAYRIYVPDAGRGEFGGVPAPVITLVAADGKRTSLPMCNAPPSDAAVTNALAAAGPAAWGLPNLGLLASSTPTWHKYVNAPNGYAIALTENKYTPPALEAELSAGTLLLPAGLGENVDNKYVFTNLSAEFGEVVEFRAKLPTTPRTFAGERRMGTGQMRYWSMCTGTSATQTLGCVFDEHVPVNKAGYFTIAISTAADRPPDATARCGVAWLPWGPQPKGLALMRNMLPIPSFKRAIQDVTPGGEARTMGAYYPVGRYFATPQAFERRVGCHRPYLIGR